jgi:hypothetical protein
MFPLTDLSILFTALLIIALLCIGLIVLLGILICKKSCRERNIPLNLPPVENQAQATPSSQLTSAPSDLENIKKEVILGTNIAIYGLAFAISIYAVQNLTSNTIRNQWYGFMGWLIALIMLSLTEPIIRKWIVSRPKQFKQSVDYTKIVLWFILIMFTIWLFVRLLNHA